jgi:hypothetical protein
MAGSVVGLYFLAVYASTVVWPRMFVEVVVRVCPSGILVTVVVCGTYLVPDPAGVVFVNVGELGSDGEVPAPMFGRTRDETLPPKFEPVLTVCGEPSSPPAFESEPAVADGFGVTALSGKKKRNGMYEWWYANCFSATS